MHSNLATGDGSEGDGGNKEMESTNKEEEIAKILEAERTKWQKYLE